MAPESSSIFSYHAGPVVTTAQDHDLVVREPA
jgi:hypothetical protein